MRNRIFAVIGEASVAIVIAATSIGVAGQAKPAAQPAKPAAAKKALPRTADGHPDLTGVYDLATLTRAVTLAHTRAVVQQRA